jgi:RHH-type proline utilization regulon transcriptional repressor/proline dehydrogenase/delta 1-pyrroline-5-carboxylate dehydrogenase
MLANPSSSPLRQAIAAATRRAEPACVAALLAEAQLTPTAAGAARDQARVWVEALRQARARGGGVDALMREFSLSSDEGIALMCLAEALLRIPDRATAEALIREKIGAGDWRSHIGRSRSLFVNAAAWGLMISGRLVATHSEEGLGAALTRLVARGGEPLVRTGVDLALRLLGQQFVTGETIDAALERAAPLEARGYRYSYDMLGEAALTAADAERYLASYEAAAQAIGAAAAGRGPRDGPGISVKLSALHPRYARAQRDRVLAELTPRLLALCRLAAQHDIGLNIDAEESERLDLSLDLVEAVAFARDLAGWQGLGFVVQAYQRRAPFVIDWLADLAHRSARTMMVRLVKGAYWDSEIKRAQVEGQSDFPVFTRKAHTDVSYLACARRMLAAERIFPQFATHNALTAATVIQMADAARPGAAGRASWEFQCLHGMGEALYDQVVDAATDPHPCRIYAPVGHYETLLPYLVRRLLENGANSSFVNRIVDPAVAIDDLLADPTTLATRGGIRPHPGIAAPGALFPDRPNSRGLDLNDEPTLARLDAEFAAAASMTWHAEPLLENEPENREAKTVRRLLDPARSGTVVGTVQDASGADIESAITAAVAAAPNWARRPAPARAALLEAAADRLEAQQGRLMWLAIHEAGKTVGNALGEVREAVDFLRYYAVQARSAAQAASDEEARPRGVVATISPWNFPLAIFLGQVAAALAAGNVVLAKPAEQTPLIAAAAVRLLHEAGVPAGALQLLPGDGRVGAALCADPRVAAVLFTGSTEVAAEIDRVIAARRSDHGDGDEAPLIAETGGQNAMIVDSSALPEQVVADVLASAFDSAGQRCSALRVLCLQQEIAGPMMRMLDGALAELRIGTPERLDVDIGPVIDAPAQAKLEAHIARMARIAGPAAVHQAVRAPSSDTAGGTFVAPTVIEIANLDLLQREVFGPVLHVIRYRREDLGTLIDAINRSGYGLTLGVHSRIDETIDDVIARARVGNIYVNRNMIGAVVGCQPFGGEGLSGTGPKAGGPWMLARLQRGSAGGPPRSDGAPIAAARRGAAGTGGRVGSPLALAQLEAWAAHRYRSELADCCADYARATVAGNRWRLPGPTGETNTLEWHPRGRALCLAGDAGALLAQVAAAFATGNLALVASSLWTPLAAAEPELAALAVGRVESWEDWREKQFDVALYAGADAEDVRREIAARDGARLRVVTPIDGRYDLAMLLAERTVSVNTAAAGGNASLMMLGAEG